MFKYWIIFETQNQYFMHFIPENEVSPKIFSSQQILIVNAVSAPVVFLNSSDWCIGKQTVQYLSDAWLILTGKT